MLVTVTDRKLKQNSLVQFQAILSLLLRKLGTVAIMENARFRCFFHGSYCVFAEGRNDVKVKLSGPCLTVLLLKEQCLW